MWYIYLCSVVGIIHSLVGVVSNHTSAELGFVIWLVGVVSSSLVVLPGVDNEVGVTNLWLAIRVIVLSSLPCTISSIGGNKHKMFNCNLPLNKAGSDATITNCVFLVIDGDVKVFGGLISCCTLLELLQTKLPLLLLLAVLLREFEFGDVADVECDKGSDRLDEIFDSKGSWLTTGKCVKIVGTQSNVIYAIN